MFISAKVPALYTLKRVTSILTSIWARFSNNYPAIEVSGRIERIGVGTS